MSGHEEATGYRAGELELEDELDAQEEKPAAPDPIARCDELLSSVGALEAELLAALTHARRIRAALEVSS